MQKGLGVIIATKSKKGKLMTDTVVSCDAKFFSVESPCVLQTADFLFVSLHLSDFPEVPLFHFHIHKLFFS